MDQYQTIQPLLPVLALPSLPIFPMQQRQSAGPFFSPVIEDDCDPVISSSIVSVNNNNNISLLLPVVIVTSSPYTALVTDLFIGVNNTGTSPFSVVLPANPQTGKVYIIKDIAGNAIINNITVSAIGHTIDGGISAVISADYGSITLVFDGVEWSIV